MPIAAALKPTSPPGGTGPNLVLVGKGFENKRPKCHFHTGTNIADHLQTDTTKVHIKAPFQRKEEPSAIQSIP